MYQLFINNPLGDFRLGKDLRDGELKSLGFRNLDQALMPATAMTPARLVPCEGGWRKRQVDMFKGLVAPIVIDGLKRDLLSAPPSLDEVKTALEHEDARWGFVNLHEFQSGGNIQFLNELAAKAGEK